MLVDGSGVDHPSFGAHTIYEKLVGQGGEKLARRPRKLADLHVAAAEDLDQPVFLTDDVFLVEGGNTAGRWRSPYPLADGRIAASWSPGPVFEGTAPQPRWRLVAMNGDDQRPLAPGQAVAVRVLREDVRTANYYGDFPDHADPDVAVLGTAPVYADGSFAVAVSADVPVQWELLDAAGKVLVRERFGTELEAGEVRRCAGCHSPHNGAVGRMTNLALESPANLSGHNLDLDGNGVVDLLEALDTVFTDGFESGNLSAWSVP